MHLKLKLILLLGVALAGWPLTSEATTWKVNGKIGLAAFTAQMDDSRDPVMVMIRLDNQALVNPLNITSYFVQMTDANRELCRQVSADEMVSDDLDQLRRLMPQHEKDIDELLASIRADYPQEKIVKVYAQLKRYMDKGRPIQWRAKVENFLLGKPPSSGSDIQEANRLIESIGELSHNYFWPGSIAPGESKTGILFFKRPVKQPASLFLQVGTDFIGLPFEVEKSNHDLNP